MFASLILDALPPRRSCGLSPYRKIRGEDLFQFGNTARGAICYVFYLVPKINSDLEKHLRFGTDFFKKLSKIDVGKIKNVQKSTLGKLKAFKNRRWKIENGVPKP